MNNDMALLGMEVKFSSENSVSISDVLSIWTKLLMVDNVTFSFFHSFINDLTNFIKGTVWNAYLQTG